MKIPGLKKQPRPKQYNYQPVFYNKQKEYLQERFDMLQTDESADSEEKTKARLRANYSSLRERRFSKKNDLSHVGYSIRMLLIASVLLYLAYKFFIQSNAIDTFVERLF